MAMEPADIVRKDGKIFHEDQEYIRLPIRLMHCEVTELTLVSIFSQHDLQEAPTLDRAFTGRARLTEDTICIVGTKYKRATQLEIRIARAVPENAPKGDDADPQSQYRVYGRDILSSIGFEESNWEVPIGDLIHPLIFPPMIPM